ncbi:hypothetical protein SAMN04487930_101536 [Cytophaga hutchinsonii ATCC 33406]|nr:hypothetical protein SAMN04487930_101536 [Cytophaga hutchinsonii ATCC 33406]
MEQEKAGQINNIYFSIPEFISTGRRYLLFLFTDMHKIKVVII